MKLDIVVITGMSGSGKSVALRALEDAGYYCMDNLPPELLDHVRQLDISRLGHRLAIVIDVRSADALPLVPQQLQALRAQGLTVRSIFLDADDATLVHRFSETRRRHPLSSPGAQHQQRALIEAIQLERELLNPMREQSHVIDTSTIRPAKLQSNINDLIAAASHRLNLVFESFAFKRGIPVDADYVFDVRMLPNPHYDPALRNLTGLDAAVIEFLQQDEQAQAMLRDIETFLQHWLPLLAQNHRSYVTVAIGCTGGQHRSVYLVEQLASRFAVEWVTLKRHREVG